MSEEDQCMKDKGAPSPFPVESSVLKSASHESLRLRASKEAKRDLCAHDQPMNPSNLGCHPSWMIKLAPIQLQTCGWHPDPHNQCPGVYSELLKRLWDIQ